MTSHIRDWSTSAASNNATPPYGAPEGGTFMSQVSDIFRQIMADVRAWWENPGWIDYGHTPTYVSSTQFTVTGDQTSIYEVGRRLRATDSIGDQVFGTITASSHSTTTAVTVDWDSDDIDNTVAEVAVGAAGVANPWLSFSAVGGSVDVSQLPQTVLWKPGNLKEHAGGEVEEGWLACDGSAVSRTTYAALFEAIGTAWGEGDGSTTFNLPDLGGRATVGKEATATRLTAAVSGVDGATVGAVGGDQRVQQHTHTATVTDPQHSHGFTVRGNGTGVGGSPYPAVADSQAIVANASTSSAATGITVANDNYGSGTSQNVQPTAVVLKIIKT